MGKKKKKNPTRKTNYHPPPPPPISDLGGIKMRDNELLMHLRMHGTHTLKVL